MPAPDDADTMGVEALASLLRANIEHYDNIKHVAHNQVNRLLLFAYTVAGFVIPLTLRYEVYGVLIIVPLAVVVAFLVAQNHLHEVMVVAAHMNYHEEKLRKLLTCRLAKDVLECRPSTLG